MTADMHVTKLLKYILTVCQASHRERVRIPCPRIAIPLHIEHLLVPLSCLTIAVELYFPFDNLARIIYRDYPSFNSSYTCFKNHLECPSIVVEHKLLGIFCCIRAMASPADIQRSLNGPALAPPTGVLPNFVDPENVHVAVYVTGILCVFISTLVFWIRVYTRLYIFGETEWEDCKFSSSGFIMIKIIANSI